MPKPKSDPHLEIAHVLFIDVVGYSKLLVNEQREVVQELNQVVRKTPQFRKSNASEKLISIPSGDGMALVFFHTPEDPVQCAMEIARALNNHPRLRLRMGVHSGPVEQVKDVNDRNNVAGMGINIARRVMDCGDAGHILLSKRVADDLAQYRRWQPYLHELGDFEVKHGVVVSVVNLYADVVGNPNPPAKFSRISTLAPGAVIKTKRMPWHEVVLALLVIAGLGAAGVFFFRHRTPQPQSTAASFPPPAAAAVSSVPEKSVAVLPFANLSANQENAFFTDGVQDQILTELARIADLKVISRTS